MSFSRSPSVSVINLLLIDADPVFRLGVRVWLEQYADLHLVAEAEDGETALQILDHQFAQPIAAPSPVPPVTLIGLEISLGRSNPDQLQGLQLCGLIKSRYPDLPILCFGAAVEPIILAAAQQAGANGYCPKTIEPAEFVRAMRRIAAGQSLWNQIPAAAIAPISPPAAAIDRSPRSPALARFRRSLRYSGIRQIDAALTEVTAELRNPDLALLNRAILAGRQRELRVARWCVSQLLATPGLETDRLNQAAPSLPSTSSLPPRSSHRPSSVQSTESTALADSAQPQSDRLSQSATSAIVAPANEALEVQVKSVIFDRVLNRLQTSLVNQTDIPLETDILQTDRKRELFYLVLRKLEEALDELRYSQIEPRQLPAKRSAVLLDLWQATIIDFLGRYYTVQLGEADVEVVEVLLQDAVVVETAILSQIPGVTELIQHLLFQTPLIVDGVAYAAGNPESLARAELLLEHLMVQVGNAVMQPLLNRFANVEVIKQSFYDRRLLSSREIERFRNNLSWRYRLDRLYREPKNIFESHYLLFVLTGKGIQQTRIYAPRTEELEKLSGLPYAVTLVLETRDAVSPRIRSVVSFVGNSVVYVLTEVIGRGIGLIGRGVLKGLGNVWQDPAKRDRPSR